MTIRGQFYFTIYICGCGCASRKGEGFAVYLLAHDITVAKMPIMSHLELTDEPLISVIDIVSYIRETHETELTAKVYMRITNLEIPVNGKTFVVFIDRSPVCRAPSRLTFCVYFDFI
ncbi:MAG: hypothetical protein ABSF21_02390 [Dehalococcoidia bacterium]|jgi:hypothetical protein